MEGGDYDRDWVAVLVATIDESTKLTDEDDNNKSIVSIIERDSPHRNRNIEN
jgi:hypothetical protein